MQDFRLRLAREHLALVQEGRTRIEALQILREKEGPDFFEGFSSDEQILASFVETLSRYLERDPFARPAKR